MAPINQYINMLTGFLDKKFILSSDSVDSLGCFIHECACLPSAVKASFTVRNYRQAKELYPLTFTNLSLFEKHLWTLMMNVN